MKRLIALLALAGCGGSTFPYPVKTAELRVGRLLVFTDHTRWESSPWARLSDGFISYPVYLIVATNGYGCVVAPEVMTMTNEGQMFSCPTLWRNPRP